ncbi:MAG: hypothetical protein II309_03930 [Bacilli bacterium]|jgi:hypothetical protein|nr:hypothetical protein [Bacilli bacterium]
MDFNINDLINEIDFESNSLEKINNNLYLSKKEIEVLKRYNIDYMNANSMNELIYRIEDILNYEFDNPDYEDLEIVSENLSERNYYINTNK